MTEATTTCQATACNCGGERVTYIVGPLCDGSYEKVSRICADLHLGAGYKVRQIPVEEKE